MKPYVKPELYYESFELAQHIAGCSLTWTNNATDVSTCSASGIITSPHKPPAESQSWFIDANTLCTAKADQYCYSNGALSIATINS